MQQNIKTKSIWLLISQQENPKTKQTIFSYVDTLGRILKIEPHPKKPFAYYVDSENNAITKREQTNVVNGYIKNAVRQHEFLGGFQEAISKIIIN